MDHTCEKCFGPDRAQNIFLDLPEALLGGAEGEAPRKSFLHGVFFFHRSRQRATVFTAVLEGGCTKRGGVGHSSHVAPRILMGVGVVDEVLPSEEEAGKAPQLVEVCSLLFSGLRMDAPRG